MEIRQGADALVEFERELGLSGGHGGAMSKGGEERFNLRVKCGGFVVGQDWGR